MSDEKSGSTIGDAGVKSVEALEKMGTAVATGVESLAKDVRQAADTALTAATGMAQHAYPQLVRRQAAEGRAKMVYAIGALGLAIIFAAIAASILVYGMGFSRSSDGGAIVRSVAFFVCCFGCLISLGCGISGLSDGWADTTEPEGRVISDLLNRFTRC